nr:MAG TPA: hypothetical protein [Caudoviricetes sp.]
MRRIPTFGGSFTSLNSIRSKSHSSLYILISFSYICYATKH